MTLDNYMDLEHRLKRAKDAPDAKLMSENINYIYGKVSDLTKLQQNYFFQHYQNNILYEDFTMELQHEQLNCAYEYMLKEIKKPLYKQVYGYFKELTL